MTGLPMRRPLRIRQAGNDAVGQSWRIFTPNQQASVALDQRRPTRDRDQTLCYCLSEKTVAEMVRVRASALPVQQFLGGGIGKGEKFPFRDSSAIPTRPIVLTPPASVRLESRLQ